MVHGERIYYAHSSHWLPYWFCLSRKGIKIDDLVMGLFLEGNHYRDHLAALMVGIVLVSGITLNSTQGPAGSADGNRQSPKRPCSSK